MAPTFSVEVWRRRWGPRHGMVLLYGPVVWFPTPWTPCPGSMGLRGRYRSVGDLTLSWVGSYLDTPVRVCLTRWTSTCSISWRDIGDVKPHQTTCRHKFHLPYPVPVTIGMVLILLSLSTRSLLFPSRMVCFPGSFRKMYLPQSRNKRFWGWKRK